MGNVSNMNPILDYQKPEVFNDLPSHNLTIKEERRCLNKSEPESIANVSNTNPILDYQMSDVSSELPSLNLTETMC
jgi:hypothetical protein